MDEQSGDERTAAQDEDDQKNQAIHSNRLASINCEDCGTKFAENRDGVCLIGSGFLISLSLPGSDDW